VYNRLGAERLLRPLFFYERRKQYMKTKLRRFTAVLSAMLCMICCVLSAVPAFADDTDSVFTEHIFSQLENTYPHSEYSYMVISYKLTDSSLSYFQCFVVSQSSKIFYNSSDRTVSTDGTFIDSFVHRFKEYSCNREVRYGNIVYADIKDLKIIYSDLPVYEGDVPIYTDPNAPLVPFSVQYSRKLTTGMSRSGTLSAPGAKNDGETITNNNIDVTVKLTDEYKQAMQKALDKDPKATQYTYQYVLFITPYDPNIFGTKKAMDGAIYTFLDKSKYVLTTAYGKTKPNTTTDLKYDTVSTPDSSSTDTSSSNVGEMTSENADGVANSAFCNGVTPLFGLPIANGANMTNTHTINLENIKGADKLGEQDILYIVVVGKRYLYETGAEGYAKDFYANNAEFKTFYKELPDNAVASKINGLYGGNGYDFYTVVSDGFSFKDYPDYKPLEINGVEYPTDKPISNMLDDPFPPSKITDYDGLENGTDFDTKEDFDDYINNKKYDEQYGSFNFNLTDISSIFDGSSDFFKFMTASIGILPPIFITILIAFFTIMLTICLVKWVVK
jgi:hypothetical protein